MHIARTLALPTVCWVWPMHHTTVEGRFIASVWATLNTCSSGMPVTSCTRSGVQVMISSLTFSRPKTRSSMYFWSSQPFLKMWYSMPQMKGMSVPERMRTYWSAFAAVRVKRGSTTIILQPFSLACSMCSIDTGCASAAFEPMYSAAFENCMSL